jgi:hypothetical protein
VTTIIISPPDVGWVDPTADLLRDRGMKVVRLGTLAIIGFLLMSDRIAAVVVHEDCVPEEWEAMRDRMQRIAPTSKILIIARDDARSPTDLAAWMGDS